MASSKILFHDYKEHETFTKRRKSLCEQWKDFDIFDCSDKAAKLVLFYKEIERARFRDYTPFGKCLFFWDRENIDGLCLAICSENQLKVSILSIEIDEAGFLFFDNRVYESPQRFLDTMSLEKNFVYQRIKIFPKSPLWWVLAKDFPSELHLQYPPDYPPLLGNIAVENRDYTTALKILQHPSMQEDRATKKNKFLHFLNSLGISAAKAGSYCFLKALANTFPLMDELSQENISLFGEALCSGKKQAAEYILRLYSENRRLLALEKCVILSVLKKKWDAFDCVIKIYDGKITLAEKERVPFLSFLLLRLGSYSFLSFVKQWDIDIAWPDFIADLLNKKISPALCLETYVAFGGKLENLEQNLKSKILESFIRYTCEKNAFEIFIHSYPEFKTVFSDVLHAFVGDEKNVNLLLDFGFIPEKKHFITLFTLNLHEETQFNLSKTLLHAIPDLESARKNLTVASLFGQDFVDLVFETFPQLKKNSEFIYEMAMEIANGASTLVTRSFNQKNMALKDPWSLISKEITFTPTVESVFFMPLQNKSISVQLLYNFLVPIKDFEKLESLLLKRTDCILEFWKGLAFMGIENFNDSGWQLLAKNTMPLLALDANIALLKHLFYYSHLPLAELILKSTPSISSEEVTTLYQISLLSCDPKVVNVFANCGFLFVTNENGENLLHISAKEKMYFHAAELIKLGIDCDSFDNNGHTAYDTALKNKQITLCKLLKKDCIKKIALFLLEKEPQDFKDWLWGSFLNSSSEDVLNVLAFIEQLDMDNRLSKEIKELLFLVKFPGTLIVRFQSSLAQWDMMNIYRQKKHASYEVQQLSWAKVCEGIYREFYQEFEICRQPVLEVLMKFSRQRGGGHFYDTWRFSGNSSLITPFAGRYFSFWKIAQRVYRAVCSNPQNYRNEVALTENGYQIYYENIPLTENAVKAFLFKEFFEAKIVHTSGDKVAHLLSLMHDLFEEIKAFTFRNSQAIAGDLKKKIALLFWLGCHIAATARGSSQYMVILHRLCYNIHGFQPAPWSQKFVQPDCVALLLPFEWFYKEFYDDLFDFPPYCIDEI